MCLYSLWFSVVSQVVLHLRNRSMYILSETIQMLIILYLDVVPPTLQDHPNAILGFIHCESPESAKQ